MKNKRFTWRLGYWGVGLFCLASQTAYASISGQVFRDFNGDGQHENAEPLVAGVLVRAYDAAGKQCGTTQTTTSVADPVPAGAVNYTLDGCSGKVRLEFEIPASGCKVASVTDFSASGADKYGSSVQFLEDGTNATADFGLQDPSEYGSATGVVPDIYSIAMRAGDPLVASPTAGDDTYTANQSTVLKAAYDKNGRIYAPGDSMPQDGPLAEREVGFTTLANAGQTGTLWGNAYSKQAKRLFVSAFLRRHAGMGPLGSGGIYLLDPAAPNLSANLNFVSLDALGFPTHAATGVLNVKSNSARGLPAVPYNVPTHDVDAYDQVGKVALGDLELSEDGRYLYTVNLYDRKLYRLDLRDAANPLVPTAAQVSSYSIPDACGGKAGESRPFALKTYRGQLYVGSVCSGEDASGAEVGTSSDMKLNVFAYDPQNLATAPSTVYTQTLAYRDHDTLQWGAENAAWSSWTKDFHFNDRNEPILTDIEFDNNGNLLLGLTDRNGYQAGSNNYSTDLADTNGYKKAYANGDLLKITRGDDCSLTPATGSYSQGDFYNDNVRWGNAYGCGEDCHGEIALGGLATHRFATRDEVVTTALNPVYYTSNGYIAFNNQSGAQVRANEVWYDPYWFSSSPSTSFGKAGGLGDLEVMAEPAPIEIGNRVWKDLNGDGLQGADEPGIDDVEVTLVCDNDPVNKATTMRTVNGGQYLFSSRVNASFLTPGSSCVLGIASGQANILGLSPTKKDATDTVANPDWRDSDASNNAGTAEIAFTVGKPGENNHMLDFGYSVPVAKPDLKLLKSFNKPRAVSGGAGTYTLTLTNEGTVPASGVKVTDKLPAGVRFSDSTAGRGSYDPASGVWDVGNVAAGEVLTLQIVVSFD
jgi:uncharacterized repeat protein (TIGR01451 family)